MKRGRYLPRGETGYGLALYGSSAILVLFLLLPLLALLLRALGSQLPPPQSLSIAAIAQASLVSMATSAVSLCLVIAFGTPLAIILARHRFPLKRLLSLVVQVPIVMPPVVAGLSLLLAFGRRGIFSWWLESADLAISFTPAAVVLAQVFVSAPYYIRAAQVRFQSVPFELEEAAAIDGASAWQGLRHILLPLSWRGLFIGMLLSWARALGEFGATILFAGSLQGSTQTLPLLVYASLERDLGAAIWTGIVLIVAAGIAMGAAQWLVSEEPEDGGDPLTLSAP